MRKRSLCCPPVSDFMSVRRSVCLCVTLVDFIHIAEDIVKPASQSASTITVVFCPPSADTKFKGDSLQRGTGYTGGAKILRFSTEIAVNFGNCTISAYSCYGTLIGSHRRRIDPCLFR